MRFPPYFLSLHQICFSTTLKTLNNSQNLILKLLIPQRFWISSFIRWSIKNLIRFVSCSIRFACFIKWSIKTLIHFIWFWCSYMTWVEFKDSHVISLISITLSLILRIFLILRILIFFLFWFWWSQPQLDLHQIYRYKPSMILIYDSYLLISSKPFL